MNDMSRRPEAPGRIPEWGNFPGLKRLPHLRSDRTPYKFQDFAVYRALLEPAFVIGAATGLGKTFMSYQVWEYFKQVFPRGRMIVLTNKSATLQFQGEYRNFYDATVRAAAIHNKMPKLGQKTYGQTRVRAYDMFGDPDSGDAFDLLVMNYALFRLDIEKILAQVERLVAAGIQVILAPDEATAFCNPETQTYRAVNSVVGAALSSEPAGKVLPLTATLTKGKLEQIYGIFCAMNLGQVIAANREEFLDRYCETVASSMALVEPERLDRLYLFLIDRKLDEGVAANRKMFLKRYGVKVRKTPEGLRMAHLAKRDLDDIYALVRRDPGIAASLPKRADFYRHLGVTFGVPEKGKEKIIIGYRHMEEFTRKIAPYCIILRKTDVAGFLPPFVPQKIWLPHSDEQTRLIAAIYSGEVDIRQFGNEFGDLSSDADAQADAARSLITVERISEQGHIRRALLDPRLVYKKGLDDYSPTAYSPKTAELIRFLQDEATDEKIIVYSPSKRYLKLLAETIRHAEKIEEPYADPMEIHGDISASQREAYRVQFQESDARRLILINDAGLESLNLQSASILIVAGMPRSGGDMIQLAGRLSRLGSTHVSLMVLYLLIQDSQDSDDYDVTQRQMQLSALVLGEAEKGLLDHARLRELDGIDDGISDEDYRTVSMARLVLARRPRRSRAYLRAAAEV